ncbi:MAG: Calx-beta domain-containing protein [Verrucomicrobiota bacterium]
MIRWTAPFSGVADLTASFEGLNPFGTTTDAHVWHNGTALDTASVNGVGVSSRVGFHETLPVVLGDTLDFGVGNGNNGHYCDSTLLAARIAVYTTDTIIYLSQRAYSLEETNATLPVEVRRFGTDKLTLPVSVDYATVDGTAHAGEDYVAVSGTLHFAAGETNQQIAIPILNDTLEEGEEQFRLVLSNPTGGVLLGSSNVVLRILSDEPMTYYVNVNNPNPVFPFTTWATAATNIQAAVDVSKAGDTVLVTNGIYRTGSLEAEGPNRVVLTNHLLLRSVNGPEVTILDGGGGVRCVHLASNAMLSGFTLRNGMAVPGVGSVVAHSQTARSGVIRRPLAAEFMAASSSTARSPATQR